jgi:hypothetical protein
MNVAPGKTIASMLGDFLKKPLKASELVVLGNFLTKKLGSKLSILLSRKKIDILRTLCVKSQGIGVFLVVLTMMPVWIRKILN